MSKISKTLLVSFAPFKTSWICVEFFFYIIKTENKQIKNETMAPIYKISDAIDPIPVEINPTNIPKPATDKVNKLLSCSNLVLNQPETAWE